MNHDDEWQAQEQALRRERVRGASDDRDSAQVRSYRVVMRTLKQPPPDLLPENFAEQVAARAERDAVAPARLESGLLATLMTTLLCGLIALVVLDGQDWLHAIAGVRLIANPWIHALLGCLALSQGIAWMRPAGPRGHRPEA
jgi:predicted lipid-binding transport protein (Tim44 family)